MKMVRSLLTFILFMFYATMVFAQENHPLKVFTVEVRKGDNLTRLVRRELTGKLFGPTGLIVKVKKLNPWLEKSEMMTTGMKIILPEEDKVTPEALAFRLSMPANIRPPLPSYPIVAQSAPEVPEVVATETTKAVETEREPASVTPVENETPVVAEQVVEEVEPVIEVAEESYVNEKETEAKLEFKKVAQVDKEITEFEKEGVVLEQLKTTEEGKQFLIRKKLAQMQLPEARMHGFQKKVLAKDLRISAEIKIEEQFAHAEKEVVIEKIESERVESTQKYIIQKGDVLSKVIRKFKPIGKLYGEGGLVEQFAANNPHLSDVHKLDPGQEVIIGQNLTIINVVKRTDTLDTDEKPVKTVTKQENTEKDGSYSMSTHTVESENKGLVVLFHMVEKGDTLSHIVRMYFPEGRLYGKMGLIEQVKKLNTWIPEDNVILPGQKVVLREKNFDPYQEVIKSVKVHSNNVPPSV
ncbi:MAG: LysM peptidoglycan-binding domain-containing protein [Bacteriovoracaceae bacterium]|nr:LysM peptidoglycan-binding domain-containing protein [Bacteriovoracaceae bacterium]